MEMTVVKKQMTYSAMQAHKRVAAYARVSSEKEGMLHSLTAQVSHYSGYIRSHPGWIFAGIYADEGITGTKSSRPEFARMLDDCRAGKIDLLLTKSISRFARNTVDLLNSVRELKDIGVDVYFEEQNIRTMSGDGELILTILASFAQEESLSASENCKWRIRKRFENGELVSLRFMFGYRISKGKVEVDSEQAEIVRMIFRDYIGGMGGDRIAVKLRAMKVPTQLGGRWDGERVLKIIRNEKYTGNALLQKKYVTDHLTKKQAVNKGQLPKYEALGTHPAIVSQETFDEAQAVLNERLRSCGTRSKGVNTYPLSGMIRCGQCGKNFKRTAAKGKAVWNCPTYYSEGKAACSARGIPEETLKAVISGLLGTPEFDESLFRRRISGITAKEAHRLGFSFRDGHIEERDWEPRSRRESWTDEMRQAAREYANRRWNNGDKR